MRRPRYSVTRPSMLSAPSGPGGGASCCIAIQPVFGDAADDILQVVERQVAARHDEVRPDRIELVAERRLVNFVRDREYLQGRAAVRRGPRASPTAARSR